MREPGLRERAEAAGREVEAAGSAFAAAAGVALEHALERGMERLVVSRAAWFNALDERTAAALRTATADAIRRAGRRIAERLADPDLWLSPSVRLDQQPPRPMDALDHLANRVWVTLLNGAEPLEPVLLEFGCPPSDVSDMGGGHFGLQPQTATELDPSGRLSVSWRRYVAAYAHLASAREARDRQETRANRESAENEARRRWRGGG
jgi:hypothetical protein